MKKLIILGSNGFVGSQLFNLIGSQHLVLGTTRKMAQGNDSSLLYFDLADPVSWQNVFGEQPDVVINCIGYGVVKHQKDAETMFDINFRWAIKFYEELYAQVPHCKLIHIGTAFEYKLIDGGLTEDSICLPSTLYGISKWMASRYLLEEYPGNNFIILRPFNMFGPGEDASKIIPTLILAQLQDVPVGLSSGMQKRDYFSVSQLANVVSNLSKLTADEHPALINVGSGIPRSIREIGELISVLIPASSSENWLWGNQKSRIGESDIFFNSSTLCKSFGFATGELKNDLLQTIEFYKNYAIQES